MKRFKLAALMGTTGLSRSFEFLDGPGLRVTKSGRYRLSAIFWLESSISLDRFRSGPRTAIADRDLIEARRRAVGPPLKFSGASESAR
jgi:hypothetical protein